MNFGGLSIKVKDMGKDRNKTFCIEFFAFTTPYYFVSGLVNTFWISV